MRAPPTRIGNHRLIIDLMGVKTVIFVALTIASLSLVSCRASAQSVTPVAEPETATATSTPPTFSAPPTPVDTPDPTSIPSDVSPSAVVEILPQQGEYEGSVTVSLSLSDASVGIQYTVDGTDPRSESAVSYVGPFAISKSTQVRAVAVFRDGLFSDEATSEFKRVQAQLASPIIKHQGGAFTEAQFVVISSNEPGSRIVFTLDGSTPSTENGTVYTGPITIEDHRTVKAKAVRSGYRDSEISQASFRVFANRVESDDDIILSEGDRLVIEDTLFVHRGDIRLSGNATLIIKNSMISHDQNDGAQKTFEASDQSSVSIENSGIGVNCASSFTWSFIDNSSLIVNGVDPTEAGCATHNIIGGESEVSIFGWDTFSGAICDSANVYIANSESLSLKLCFPTAARVNTSLPSQADQFQFGSDPTNNIGFSLKLSNVSVDGWKISVLPGSEITLFDSHAVTINIAINQPAQDETTILSELIPGEYSDQFWQIGPDAALRLVRTSVVGWEIIVPSDHNETVVG